MKAVPTLAALLLLPSSLAAGPAKEPADAAPARKPVRVLVVTGGHDYDVPAFEAMLRSFDGIEWHHEKQPRAVETIARGAAGFDAVLLYDLFQEIGRDAQRGYAGCIRSGKGLVVLHHALASFQAWPEYERLVGGRYFLEASAAGPRSTYHHDQSLSVEVLAPGHFVTRGLADFTLREETYGGFRVHPAVHALLGTSHPRSGPVIGWSKPYGKGRVVYLQPGHGPSAYADRNYRRLVSRAIRWAARRTREDALSTSLLGDDLSGWTVVGEARFAFEDGMLVGRQGPENRGGELLSIAEYEDFELEVTWAMEWPGNSGVWFRYRSAEEAYQADILEWKDPVCWSGSLYSPGKMFLSLNEDPRIVDREGWNTFLVRAEGDRITVRLNGRKVAGVRDGGSRRGRIGFQVHGGEAFEGMAIRIAEARVRELR